MGISASLHSFYGLDQSEGESWRSPPRASSHRVIILLPAAHWAPLTCWKLSLQYWAASLNMHAQLPCNRNILSRKASPVRKRLFADYTHLQTSVLRFRAKLKLNEACYSPFVKAVPVITYLNA